MTWLGEVREVERRREATRQMCGPERVAKQCAQGTLTVRERVAMLFDSGTFEELGILADDQSLRENLRDRYAPADGVIVGIGRIDGRYVCTVAKDFTVLGGTVGRAGAVKRAQIREIAGRSSISMRLSNRERPVLALSRYYAARSAAAKFRLDRRCATESRRNRRTEDRLGFV